MTTFELARVQNFIAGLEERMAACENGEGMQCATLDAALSYHAKVCCDFIAEVKQWGQAVFAGRETFNPEVETQLKDAGMRLYLRANVLLAHAHVAEGPCYLLVGQPRLQNALSELYRLLSGWVTPSLAIAPSARRTKPLGNDKVTLMRERLAALRPLPPDWQPDDPTQRKLYKMGK